MSDARAARREWLILAGPSPGRAHDAHHRSTSRRRATRQTIPPILTDPNAARVRLPHELVKRRLELRRRRLRCLGAPLSRRLPVLGLRSRLALAHEFGP